MLLRTGELEMRNSRSVVSVSSPMTSHFIYVDVSAELLGDNRETYYRQDWKGCFQICFNTITNKLLNDASRVRTRNL